MKLGKEIAQIRKDNSMTQEAFGQIFHVTRQTVSNWENEKSYPDLETLVAISDRFGISLDTLLKEDEHMIQTIDKERRRGKRLLKIVIAALSVVVIACASYSGYWYYQKASFEERFESTLARYDFTQMTAIDEDGNLEALEAAPEADFLDAYEAHKSDIRSAVSTMREMLNAFYA